MLSATTLYLQAAAGADSIGAGELVKYMLLAAITLAIGMVAKDSRETRDGVRSLKQSLEGTKDQPGLSALVQDLIKRMGAVESWQREKDAVEESTKERSYTGPERRQSRRREMDQHLLPSPPISTSE